MLLPFYWTQGMVRTRDHITSLSHFDTKQLYKNCILSSKMVRGNNAIHLTHLCCSCFVLSCHDIFPLCFSMFFILNRHYYSSSVCHLTFFHFVFCFTLLLAFSNIRRLISVFSSLHTCEIKYLITIAICT